MARITSAALGLLLVALCVLALAYNGPAWMAWADAGAAVVALAGVAMLGGDIPGVVTWPLLGIFLSAIWVFGLGARGPAWLVWSNFVAACGFLALTASALLPRHDGVTRRQSLSRHRPHGVGGRI